ncbi:pyridoxal phosphate-dependent transferase [Polychytrium aggregatum]|uniref:pyridoxal phosphate-dependent transferase n=1 Tax=Polychytrium aggregatum TaxID=110093 RepID=UPI0022FEC40B|nr:pyridoxal phosphate-dependent transferase [Polychytrium aggregatum]KAI9204985.1 pyridoxal phosphate-dependent transferase [Polychytrium aggregatum]
MTIQRTDKVLQVSKLNPNVVNVEYAVRGELAIRAEQLKEQLASTPGSLPFKTITNCNIGNPQQLEQKPITFFRQVASLVDYPDLLKPENAQITSQLFKPDAVDRARTLLAAMGGSSGAYSHSKGIPLIRKHVADFIEERDGYPANPEHIFLTAGASPGVQLVLQTLIQNSNVGIMIPIPQYPLYTASIALFNGKAVPYYLDESAETFGLDIVELKRSIQEARNSGVDVRALCVINPGNPTGQVLTEESMKDIIRFCHEEKLVLLADEVYQTNIYLSTLPFHSFKKVLKSLGPAYEGLELISFNSVSKGMVGECGRRGGYFECTGVSDDIIDMFYKVASVSLCPPVQGQVMVDLTVRPPKKGDPSYPEYRAEIDAIYESLKRRATKLAAAFNSLEGVICPPAQGAMYLFPRIVLPQGAIDAAQKAGKQPDALYCMEMLNATGVCMVPGSGFCQREGTWHFRSTFLPPENQLDSFIDSVAHFHNSFVKKYSN